MGNNNQDTNIKFYIVFSYGGETLPSFAKSYGNVSLPKDIMQNIEVFWPGGFQIAEKSDQNKLNDFKEKCFISKKNNPLHACSSPDDLFLLWKASEINDIENTYLVTDDKFGSEKNFIKI